VVLHGQIVLGIDTHKHAHVGVILDGLGRVSGALQFPATEAGAQRLLAWNQENGGATIAGVEGTGSYGYPLTRALQLAGVTVLEVNRSDRANRRRHGKNDTVDAEAAARAVLSGQVNAVPKNREGVVDALRALTMTRNSAVKATTQASNQIKALLVGSPEQLRQQLTVKSLLQLETRCAELDSCSGMHTALRSLGRRWLLLHAEIVELDNPDPRPRPGHHPDADHATRNRDPQRRTTAHHRRWQSRPATQRCCVRRPLWGQPGPGQQWPTTASPPQPRR
jgi:transposase